ncbi:MAG: DNA repair protein NreA [Halobacteria archaeon]|nr:DNA repair protein NreA [Halobacteria archaeon]
MRLDDYIDNLEPEESYNRRKLAEEKSYEILDYLHDFKNRFEEVKQGDSLFGSTSPSVFVGRSNYPKVSTGVLSPVGHEDDASEFATNSDWYARGLNIENVLQYRTGLLNSNRSARVDVSRVSDRFVDVQREVAMADTPVDVEVELSDSIDIDYSLDNITGPTGPRARARSVDLAENPRVPRPVEKTLEDDEWKSQGAMKYLYESGLDVYDINRILSVGGLGLGDQRRLVPTRWSITAVDDTIGKHLHDEIRDNPSIDKPQVWVNAYMGNRYWVVLGPGKWEFELVEMKSPGSVWNPDPHGETWMASAYEGYEGRTQYVDETAGAYYAARLGVLEHLNEVGRQAKCLVLREVSDDYWAPVGVWQVRESVRNAFEGEHGEAETFHSAVREISDNLPVPLSDLRRKSTLVSGIQADLSDFS